MRFSGLSAWVSLTCLGPLLSVVAGCQLPVPEEGEGGPHQEGDPSKFTPDGSTGDPNRPPGGPGQGMPVARKLALDLKGVAGFAILDEASGDADSGKGTGAIGGTTPGAGGAPSASELWLASNSAGQVLMRSPSLAGLSGKGARVDGASVERLNAASLRGALSQPGLVSRRASASQEDTEAAPGAGAGGAGTGTGTGTGGAGATDPAEGSGSDENVGEQAGLLKITEDGEVIPALVSLAVEPLAGTAGAATDGAATEGVGTDGKPGAGGASGSDGAPTGTAGAPATGTSGAGAVAPSGAASGAGTGSSPTAAPTGPRPNNEPLPRVTALGLSPDGSVYVLFERGFFYRQPTAAEQSAEGFDPYSPNSPFRCQLFRADGSWLGGAPDQALAELECVTNQYEVPTWDTRRVMQFDASGKLYFRAVTQGNPQGVFFQYDPETRQLSEKVNANICWRDVQVTPRGSLFYTGTSGGTDGTCGGTSFFRYVSTDNRLTEIARDWWNFKYLAEQDPEDPTNERIIFYGPDPNATVSTGWDSACLYRYNPAISVPAERTQKLVECYRDGWSYVNGSTGQGPGPQQVPEDVPAFQERCESAGQLFIGGDGVTALSQLQDGSLFVVGRFQRKLAGELRCGIDVQADHCALNGSGNQSDGLDPSQTTKVDCEAAEHVWISSDPFCMNGIGQDPQECFDDGGQWNPGGPVNRHYEMSGVACGTVADGFTLNHLDCQAPGQAGTFSEEVTGLGYLVPGTDGPGEIALLSDPGERVERYWAVAGASGPELFYSVYSAGQYNLRVVTQETIGEQPPVTVRRSLLDDYEVYNLQQDPGNPSRVLFDALEFSTNSYVFGSIDPSLPSVEEVRASLQLLDGVSGRVETLIVLPNF